jgi:gluconate 2-dehydrogenase subunit 3-like protein
MVEKLLAGIAAGATWPLIASAHPVNRHLKDGALLDRADADQHAASWKPLFLNSMQNESLVALSESMLPGSAKANVNRFIDLLLSVETPENSHKFVAVLASFDAVARGNFGRACSQLSTGEMNLVLEKASTDPDHLSDFAYLKDWIVTAYYSSEEGMRELGWTENRAFRTFPAGEHASHSS